MGETEEDGAKPLRQPKKDGSQKPIRQAENEIPVFALFAILANMDPRTMSELIAKKKKENQHQGRHWLSCAPKSKTRENKYVNENAMNFKEKTQANLKKIDKTNTNLHLMESTNCAVQASKLDS